MFIHIVDAHQGYLMVEKLNELAQWTEQRLVTLSNKASKLLH